MTLMFFFSNNEFAIGKFNRFWFRVYFLVRFGRSLFISLKFFD